MVGIIDEIIAYNGKNPTACFDDCKLPNSDQIRLADFRDIFIRKVYEVLKSEELVQCFIRANEQIDVNIKIKNDHVKIQY